MSTRRYADGMIKRGVTLAFVVLLLSGCAGFGGPGVAEQQRPQVESDVLTEAQLENADLVTAESVRRLGEDDDGREFYVGSGDTQVCLIVVEDGSAASACSTGLPLTIEVPGVYHAELWPDSAATHDRPGQWIGEHLWLANRP